MGFALEPAPQEAGHEAVACPQHIIDFNRKTLANDAIVKCGRYGTGIDHTAHGATLQDNRAFGYGANGFQSVERVFAAACDVDFFFGADNQVTIGQHGLDVGRHLVGFDIAFLTRTKAREAPEVGTVVDVDNDLSAMAFGNGHGLALGLVVDLAGKVGACDQQRTSRGDEILRDVVLAQGRVGAVVAVENQRKGTVVLHREQDQRSETLGIDRDAGDINPFADHLFTDETAHLLVAYTGNERGFQPKPCRADGNVRWRAANGFRERGNVFEARTDLLAVKVNRAAAHSDHVQFRPANRCHDASPYIISKFKCRTSQKL